MSIWNTKRYQQSIPEIIKETLEANPNLKSMGSLTFIEEFNSSDGNYAKSVRAVLSYIDKSDIRKKENWKELFYNISNPFKSEGTEKRNPEGSLYTKKEAVKITDNLIRKEHILKIYKLMLLFMENDNRIVRDEFTKLKNMISNAYVQFEKTRALYTIRGMAYSNIVEKYLYKTGKFLNEIFKALKIITKEAAKVTVETYEGTKKLVKSSAGFMTNILSTQNIGLYIIGAGALYFYFRKKKK